MDAVAFADALGVGCPPFFEAGTVGLLFFGHGRVSFGILAYSIQTTKVFMTP